jgi:hypothetical protein
VKWTLRWFTDFSTEMRSVYLRACYFRAVQVGLDEMHRDVEEIDASIGHLKQQLAELEHNPSPRRAATLESRIQDEEQGAMTIFDERMDVLQIIAALAGDGGSDPVDDGIDCAAIEKTIRDRRARASNSVRSPITVTST